MKFIRYHILFYLKQLR